MASIYEKPVEIADYFTNMYKKTPQIGEFSFFLFKTILEGSLLFIAVSGILWPIGIIHQIISYGLSLFLLNKIVGRAWKSYVTGKIEIRDKPLEEINDMEQY